MGFFPSGIRGGSIYWSGSFRRFTAKERVGCPGERDVVTGYVISVCPWLLCVVNE